MASPRIYTYKVTFEEIPDWYWGAHKEKKYGELYLGSPATHAWKWKFYTPHLQICEVFPYTDEGWKEARRVEDRCILPDLNNPLCLNEHVGGLMSLDICSQAGKKAMDMGVGCTSAPLEKLSEWGTIGGAVTGLKMKKERKGIFAPGMQALGGKITHSLGVGVFTLTKEQQRELGRKTTSQKWKCLVTGHISSPGGLSRFQKVRGIDTTLRERLE